MLGQHFLRRSLGWGGEDEVNRGGQTREKERREWEVGRYGEVAGGDAGSGEEGWGGEDEVNSVRLMCNDG